MYEDNANDNDNGEYLKVDNNEKQDRPVSPRYSLMLKQNKGKTQTKTFIFIHIQVLNSDILRKVVHKRLLPLSLPFPIKQHPKHNYCFFF